MGPSRTGAGLAAPRVAPHLGWQNTLHLLHICSRGFVLCSHPGGDLRTEDIWPYTFLKNQTKSLRRKHIWSIWLCQHYTGVRFNSKETEGKAQKRPRSMTQEEMAELGYPVQVVAIATSSCNCNPWDKYLLSLLNVFRKMARKRERWWIQIHRSYKLNIQQQHQWKSPVK